MIVVVVSVEHKWSHLHVESADSQSTYHHSTGHGNAPATVCVGYYVSIAHTQNSNRNQPHRVE